MPKDVESKYSTPNLKPCLISLKGSNKFASKFIDSNLTPKIFHLGIFSMCDLIYIICDLQCGRQEQLKIKLFS